MDTPSLEQLLKTWESDSKMDQTEPSKEIMRIPLLHSKYNKFLTLHNLAIKRTSIEFNRLKKIKWMYYTGKLDNDELKKFGWEPFQFTLKSDIGVYIDGDDDLNKVLRKRAYHEEASNFCTNVMKELNNRTWQLKDFIKWELFINGQG
jgi:hypothetical protein